MAVRVRLVAVLVTVTVTAGTTAPVAYFTVPEMRPTIVCAPRSTAQHASSSRTAQQCHAGERRKQKFPVSRITFPSDLRTESGRRQHSPATRAVRALAQTFRFTP